MEKTLTACPYEPIPKKILYDDTTNHNPTSDAIDRGVGSWSILWVDAIVGKLAVHPTNRFSSKLE